MCTILMTDLDGTLLPHNKILSPVDIAAIERFRAAGNLFTIATGRTCQATQRYIDVLQPDLPCILFNGAVIYDTREMRVVAKESLSEVALSVTKEVLETFPDVSAEILSIDTTYVTRLTQMEQEHLDICQVTPVIAVPDEIPLEKWVKVLFTREPAKMQELIDFFQAQSLTQFDFVRSEQRFYEMLPKNATKGTALQKLRKSDPRFQTNSVVAVGDFDNDITMLHAADFCACPSNAQPCVQAIAHQIMKNSCDTGAIAELIDTFLASK